MSSPSNRTAQEIQEAFDLAGIHGLPSRCYYQFSTYLGLLLRWNARLNLTAIRSPEQIISRHFAECAFAAQHLPEDIETLLDYGSGAGFPGIAIAICRPQIRVTLTEAQGKKTAFLREVVRTVGAETEVYDGRIETMPPLLFDAVAMRAVEKMELAIPIAFQRVERYLVLFTTEKSAPAFKELAPGLRWRESVLLPDAGERILAIGQRADKGVSG